MWYRVHFTATDNETGINLTVGEGQHGASSVWRNGAFVGSNTSGSEFDARRIKNGYGHAGDVVPLHGLGDRLPTPTSASGTRNTALMRVLFPAPVCPLMRMFACPSLAISRCCASLK